jgi:hypothetical protein
VLTALGLIGFRILTKKIGGGEEAAI